MSHIYKIINKVFDFLKYDENYHDGYKEIYILYFIVKNLLIIIPLLLFLAIFVLIPNWLIDKFKNK